MSTSICHLLNLIGGEDFEEMSFTRNGGDWTITVPFFRLPCSRASFAERGLSFVWRFCLLVFVGNSHEEIGWVISPGGVVQLGWVKAWSFHQDGLRDVLTLDLGLLV